jgi:hypothetical protein
MKKVWVVYSPSLEVLSAHSSREESLGSTTAGLYCSVGTMAAKEAAEKILRLAGYTPHDRVSDTDVYLGLRTGREVDGEWPESDAELESLRDLLGSAFTCEWTGDGTDTEFDVCVSCPSLAE